MRLASLLSILNQNMNIVINGNAISLDASKYSVSDALTQYQASYTLPVQFAIAVNGDFVGQASYSEHQLKEGDSLDVFSPIQGG